MKIGIFTDAYYPEINGVATSCLNLFQELTLRGHDVDVYAPQCKGWEQHRNANVHYLASTPLPLLKDRNVALPNYKAIQQALDMPFDVIHTNSEFVMGSLGQYLSKKMGCACVHTYHTIWEDYTSYITHGLGDASARKFARRYSEWWCERFDRIIAPTAKTEKLLQFYGVEAPIDIIPSGIDLSRFAPEKHTLEDITSVRAECGVRDGERVLLSIGRLSKEKNVDQILRIFPALHSVCPDVRFVIIGEGPMKEQLSQIARDNSIDGFVSIIGAKPWEQIDRYYAIGDVFASTSHSETQGLTYIEAMASGLCVCAVQDPCLDNVIENGVDGILTGDSDTKLLTALQLAFSPIGKEIGKRAVHAAQPFSTEKFAENVEKCYIAAIASKAQERDSANNEA